MPSEPKPEQWWHVPRDYKPGDCAHCGTPLAFVGRGRWKRSLDLELVWTTPQGDLVAPLHRCAHGGRRGRRG